MTESIVFRHTATHPVDFNVTSVVPGCTVIWSSNSKTGKAVVMRQGMTEMESVVPVLTDVPFSNDRRPIGVPSGPAGALNCIDPGA